MRVSYKQLMLSLLYSIAIASSLSAKSLFDEFIEEINEMEARLERRFNRLQEHLKSGFPHGVTTTIETANIAIAENKEAGCVDIIVGPLMLSDKAIEARMEAEENLLTVHAADIEITAQIDRHLISAHIHQKIKREQEDTKGQKHTVAMNSFSQNAKRASQEMALEESHIEYDTPTKKLIISVPFRKKNVTKIPVAIKHEQKDPLKDEK